MAAQSSDYAGSLGMIVDQVAQEKGIDKPVLVEKMEAAIHKEAQAVADRVECVSPDRGIGQDSR